MKKLFGKPAILPVIFCAATLFAGCKEDTTIKANIAPGIDGINVTAIPDTFTILTKSILIDTLNTSKVYSNFSTLQALGVVNDPNFGRTTAGVYFQVLPPSNSFNFSSDTYVIDSAFIVLPYAGFRWGDTTVADIQKFTAWEVTESLSKDVSYYSDHKASVDATPISEVLSVDIEKLRLTDSILVNGINRPSHIRLKLTKAFLQKIANEAGKSNFDSKETFLNWFKGIHISADSSQPGNTMPYFFIDLPSTTVDYSRAAIEFNYTDASGSKTAFFSFIKESCVQYNYIKRNYSQIVKDILSGANTDILAVQNEPGTTIDIRIPYLKNLPTGIINKAQLVLTQVTTGVTNESKFYGPARIEPYHVNADGTTAVVLDLSSGSSDDYNFVNGSPTVIDIGGGIRVTQYLFNLPREIQKTVIDKTDELHLRLRGISAYPAAYSLLCGSRTHSQYKLQLNIVYSTPE